MALGALANKKQENRFYGKIKRLIVGENMKIVISHEFFGYDQPDINGKLVQEELVKILD